MAQTAAASSTPLRPNESVVFNAALQGSAAPAPQLVQDQAVAGLRLLLHVEAQMRKVASTGELAMLCVNEIAKIVRARQIFYVDLKGSKPSLSYATGAVTLDPNAPTVRWIAASIRAVAQQTRVGHALFEIAPDAGQSGAMPHPFPQGLYIPMARFAKAPVAGLLLLRESPWSEGDIVLAQRLADTAAHAQALLLAKPRRARRSWKTPLMGVAAVLGIAAMFIRVPMTALAPVEIAAIHPFIVAAPIDGIVKSIVVQQNAVVAKGDVLVAYIDTVQRDQLTLAEREVDVAKARLAQAIQTSFSDARSKRDIGQFRAELETKIAERDYARDTFAKTLVRAPRAGVAVFEDANEWRGKPVVTGNRIMEIVDPGAVEARIDLPVADGMVAGTGGRARLFLDADPVHPLEATVTSASHLARAGEAGILSYRLVAALHAGTNAPRLGLRGTAQIFARDVPLGFYLLRRPYSWFRQRTGL